MKQPDRLQAVRGSTVEVSLRATLEKGYHVNSDQPQDEYLIPLRLTWEAAPLVVDEIRFPEAKLESYSFSKVPLAVFTEDFDVVTSFQVPGDAPDGSSTVTGKLRYQACTDTLCLPPKTLNITLPVEIR